MKRCFHLVPDNTFLVRFHWRLRGSPHPKTLSSSNISINSSEASQTTAVTIHLNHEWSLFKKTQIPVCETWSNSESIPVLFITTASNLFPYRICIAETQIRLYRLLVNLSRPTVNETAVWFWMHWDTSPETAMKCLFYHTLHLYISNWNASYFTFESCTKVKDIWSERYITKIRSMLKACNYLFQE